MILSRNPGEIWVYKRLCITACSVLIVFRSWARLTALWKRMFSILFSILFRNLPIFTVLIYIMRQI